MPQFRPIVCATVYQVRAPPPPLLQLQIGSGFCKKFLQTMDKVESFLCQFPNPWALRMSGMGCYILKILSSHHQSLSFGLTGSNWSTS
jgi:hypothetical protein